MSFLDHALAIKKDNYNKTHKNVFCIFEYLVVSINSILPLFLCMLLYANKTLYFYNRISNIIGRTCHAHDFWQTITCSKAEIKTPLQIVK